MGHKEKGGVKMGCISRLKDQKYYIDFDSCCVVDDAGNVVAEITSSIQLNILSYLADNPEIWLKKDSIICHCWPGNPDADYVTDDTFYGKICEIRRIHPKIKESIVSRRNIGYKYHGQRKEDKNNISLGDGKRDNISEKSSEYVNGIQKPHEDNANIINLASLMIHKNAEERPPIDDDLKYEISELIKLLEQGLSEDFEETYEQAWAELSLMQKALRIFRAYENLTDRSPDLSPDRY